MDVIRRHRLTEEYRDILFSKILGEIKRMRKQCIPGLPPTIEGLGTRLHAPLLSAIGLPDHQCVLLLGPLEWCAFRPEHDYSCCCSGDFLWVELYYSQLRLEAA